MAYRPAAILDGPGHMAPAKPVRPHCTTRPSIIATLGPKTPQLHHVDLVRLDAAHGSLRELSELRARYDCPAILDLPGPETRQRTSLLTTSEFCLFASSEGIEWVGLRGVSDAGEVQRAREILHPSIRLASSVSHPDLMSDAQWEAVASASDAMVLPFDRIHADLGFDGALQSVERALVIAAKRSRPLVVRGGLLSTMQDSVMPEIEQLEVLTGLAEAGCAGFILTNETACCAHAQLCVETLQLVLGPLAVAPPREFGVARLVDEKGLFPHELYRHPQDS